MNSITIYVHSKYIKLVGHCISFNHFFHCYMYLHIVPSAWIKLVWVWEDDGISVTMVRHVH